MPDYARIPVDSGLRDRIRAVKRGGDTYNDVLQKMVDQYDPDEAHN